MEILATDFEQESGLFVNESKWNKRPAFNIDTTLLKDFPSCDFENRLVEICGPPNCIGKTLLTIQMAISASKNGDVVLFNCSGDIKSEHLKEASERIHIVEIFDLTSFEIAIAMLPELLHKLDLVNCLIFDGIDNPFFYHDINQYNRIQQICHKISSCLNWFDGNIIGLISKECSNNEMQWQPTCSEENGIKNDSTPRICVKKGTTNWIAKFGSNNYSKTYDMKM